MLPGIGSRAIISRLPRTLPLSLTYRSSVLSTESSGLTFNSASSVSFGSPVEPGNDRFILCLIHNVDGGGGGNWTNSCTIGGVPATKLFRLPDAYAAQVTDCWYIEDNSLSSGSIYVSWSAGGSQFYKTGFGIWTLVNPASITPTVSTNAASATSVSASTTCSASQVGLAMATPNNDSGGTISWSNATSRYNLQTNASTYVSAGNLNRTGTFNVTATQSASGNAMRTTTAVWS